MTRPPAPLLAHVNVAVDAELVAALKHATDLLEVELLAYSERFRPAAAARLHEMRTLYEHLNLALLKTIT